MNIRGNRFENETDLTARIENSLKRIDDKFSKLNTNLERYSEIMKPARDQLIDELSQGSFRRHQNTSRKGGINMSVDDTI